LDGALRMREPEATSRSIRATRKLARHRTAEIRAQIVPAPGKDPGALPLSRENEWRRLQPIRTVSDADVEFVVFTTEQFQFQWIAVEARRIRRLEDELTNDRCGIRG